MRKAFLYLLCIAGSTVFTAFSQMPAQPPLITVSGSSEVKVAPDEVYLRAGVETRNEELTEAKAQNDRAITKALAFLKKEVDSKNVQTDFISFEPVHEGSASHTKPVAYIARNSIEVKLTKIDSLDRILTGLLTNGVNTIHGIEFRTSELRKHRDAARAAAIRAAVEKADALARDLGVKRGKVYNVSASDNWWGGASSYWGNRYGFAGMAQNSVQYSGNSGQDFGESTLSAGLISVSATVSVSFQVAD
jgi:uncharacterized protein YggE